MLMDSLEHVPGVAIIVSIFELMLFMLKHSCVCPDDHNPAWKLPGCLLLGWLGETGVSPSVCWNAER